ncbi:MAG TPA: ABC transporter ATP-binding protein [Candidatus Paceibacterota bacterium]|nr:ABC transporter ATP-binding protein [Candidatus Paceibacterota bacterium]
MTQKQNKNLFKGIRDTISVAWAIDKKFFLITALLMLLGGLLPVFTGYASKLFLDSIISTAAGGITIVTSALLGILVFRYALYIIVEFRNVYLYEYVQRSSRLKAQAWLNLTASQKISGLDLQHFENPETQDLISKIWRDALGRIIPAINNIFFAGTYATTLIGSILALLSFSSWLPFVAIAITIPRLIILRDRADFSWSIFDRTAPESRKLGYYTDLTQDKDAVIETRIFGTQGYFLNQIKVMQEKILGETLKPIQKYLGKIWIPTIMENVFIFFIIYLKLPAVLSGAISIGTITFVIQMLNEVIDNSSNVHSQLSNIYEDQLYIANYFTFMNLQPLVKDKEPGHRFEEIKPPKIGFQNVSFEYPNGPAVLKKVSFSIQPGEHLAIVGPNGAGKTTLVKVLLRLYDVSKGSILINDVDLRDIPRTHWYEFVGTLFQSFQKYALTVRENITMSSKEKDNEEKMKKAAQLSGAAEFIEKFSKKYEQQLGRQFDGEELSVGQWQKLALARAFYEEAPVLILDEPTSAIDAEAEAEIFENLNNAYKHKTLIFISHRFSTVRNADKIIVLKDGEIVESGTHQSLIDNKGIYARMFQKQAKGYID